MSEENKYKIVVECEDFLYEDEWFILSEIIEDAITQATDPKLRSASVSLEETYA